MQKEKVMVQVEDRIIDYKKLKKIFSNNREIMEQVMLGLILTAHEKAPALRRHYNAGEWGQLSDTIMFIISAYQHVATKELSEVLGVLSVLIQSQTKSVDLEDKINHVVNLSSNMIQDIEYYLANK